MYGSDIIRTSINEQNFSILLVNYNEHSSLEIASRTDEFHNGVSCNLQGEY